jgi:hypothetical protein
LLNRYECPSGTGIDERFSTSVCLAYKNSHCLADGSSNMHMCAEETDSACD